MRRANKVLTPALFAIGAVAQSGSSVIGSSTVITNPSDTGVVYETYSICPTAEVTTITGPTSTYCPGPYCNGAPTNALGADGSSTTWVTELVNVCPTATDEAGWLTTMTTTITEACPCMESPTPGYVPSGHTTVLATCTVCGESSPVATIITPVATPAGAYAEATASAGAAAGAGSGSEPGSGSNAEASAAAGAGAEAGAGSGSPGSGSGSGSGSSSGSSSGSGSGSSSGSGSGSGSPGLGSGTAFGSSAEASAAAAAGANAGASSLNNAAAGAPGSSNAADYAAGSNNTFTSPISPSAGSGTGSSSASSISPPIAIETHGGAARSSIDAASLLLLGIAGLVGVMQY